MLAVIGATEKTIALTLVSYSLYIVLNISNHLIIVKCLEGEKYSFELCIVTDFIL